jgi:hypothetical protein
MAEADPHERTPRIPDLADQRLERGEPGVVFVDPVGRPGDEPGIRRVGTIGEVAVDHLPQAQLEAARFEEAGEHVEVTAVKRARVIRDATGLQNAEDHRGLMSSMHVTLGAPVSRHKGSERPWVRYKAVVILC